MTTQMTPEQVKTILDNTNNDNTDGLGEWDADRNAYAVVPLGQWDDIEFSGVFCIDCEPGVEHVDGHRVYADGDHVSESRFNLAVDALTEAGLEIRLARSLANHYGLSVTDLAYEMNLATAQRGN